MVDGDPRQLERAVRNLLTNAGRHARTTITVELQETHGTAVLAVIDDGPGIPADQRELVFERFTRLDHARSRDSGGTGLGLAITRAIIEQHGGTIGIDDAPGGGCRLVVTLPMADAAAGPYRDPPPAERTRRGAR
ncbi:MAG: sensor histidine kinase [Acidimicrobiales bacterium]